jgi:hypothetical protein
MVTELTEHPSGSIPDNIPVRCDFVTVLVSTHRRIDEVRARPALGGQFKSFRERFRTTQPNRFTVRDREDIQWSDQWCPLSSPNLRLCSAFPGQKGRAAIGSLILAAYSVPVQSIRTDTALEVPALFRMRWDGDGNPILTSMMARPNLTRECGGIRFRGTWRVPLTTGKNCFRGSGMRNLSTRQLLRISANQARMKMDLTLFSNCRKAGIECSMPYWLAVGPCEPERTLG